MSNKAKEIICDCGSGCSSTVGCYNLEKHRNCKLCMKLETLSRWRLGLTGKAG